MSTNPTPVSTKTTIRPKTRHLIQFILFIVTLSLGARFYLYVQQAAGTGPITMSRPAGVEGFLPIGALLAWKRFFISGQWDFIHPAAMVIFGFAMTLSLVFRKAFCSWLCPIGTLSEWVWKFGKRLFGRTYSLPVWLDRSLRILKYLLLGFFIWVIGRMSVGAISMFIEGDYYKVSDVKMLRFFTHMSTTTAIVLTILTIGSLFIKNFWCRYLCPYGALTGLLGAVGPTRIVRNNESCINCKKCTEVCPHYIKVHEKNAIYTPECSGCMDCVDSCPVQKTLALRTGISNRFRNWSGRTLGIVISAGFIVTITLAMYFGYWDTHLPEHEFRKLLQMIDSPLLTHPTY